MVGVKKDPLSRPSPQGMLLSPLPLTLRPSAMLSAPGSTLIPWKERAGLWPHSPGPQGRAQHEAGTLMVAGRQ